jgi:hypothetical protein
MRTLLQIILIITLTSFRSTTNFRTLDIIQTSPPVDIKIIKHLPDIVTTSGVLPTKESENLCKPNTKGFFGRYYLVHKQTGVKDPVFGQLIIFVTGKADNWKYDNNNETFAQLILTSSQIKLWDKIKIGTTEKDLLNFIGKNFHYKKGTLIYSEINEYSLECTILADTINKMTVSKYCKTTK